MEHRLNTDSWGAAVFLRLRASAFFHVSSAFNPWLNSGPVAYSANAFRAGHAAATGIAGSMAAVLPNRATIRDWRGHLGGTIVKARKLCCALVIAGMLAGVASGGAA